MTPKIRLSPRESSASTPPNSTPLITASSRKMSKKGMRRAREIGLGEGLGRGQLGGGAGRRDAARLEQVRPTHPPQPLLHVLLDDQHVEAAGADARPQVEDLLHDPRGQPRRG